MVSIVSTKLNLEVGSPLSCLYPVHGTRNILKRRVGTIEKHGHGPAGEYVIVKLLDGSHRTLSTKRMVDPVNA